MNILTHPVHTGYQFDLAKTGHDFYSIEIPESREVFWDYASRPKSKNYTLIKSLNNEDIKFDIILVHDELGYNYLKHLALPLIFKEHCLREPFIVPIDWIKRINYYVFASQTAEKSWILPYSCSPKKVIIGMGIDTEKYKGYIGNKNSILVVTNNIQKRKAEKGFDKLLALSKKFNIYILGNGNEGIPCSIGQAETYSQLIKHYQEHMIYFNPSNSLGMTTLEAMATGMPVVTFKMINSDVIKHEYNGLIVNSIPEAEKSLHLLLSNKKLAKTLGDNARKTIKERYKTDLFIKKWDLLFQKTRIEKPNINKNYKSDLPYKIKKYFYNLRNLRKANNSLFE